MINVVIPIASNKLYDENEIFQYPLPLIEILGKSIIEYSIEALKTIDDAVKFIFILKEEDCNKYHFDNSLKLLIPECSIVKLKTQTRGAVCSILMAIDILDKDSEMLIINYDQLLDYKIDNIINSFRTKNADGGLLTFKSIHPRWSYARVIGDDVLETAEKNPISNFAIAGFYYFKKTSDFIEGAFNIIRYDEKYNSSYYTSSIFNQMILKNKIIKNYTIPLSVYYSFYSAQKIKEFEHFLLNKNGKV
jgi:NDP-sugar pyrophosphorylase family protein